MRPALTNRDPGDEQPALKTSGETGRRDNVSATPNLWREFRAKEQAAAKAGGATWGEYVRECELWLGEPWSYIRARFNEMDREAAWTDAA